MTIAQGYKLFGYRILIRTDSARAAELFAALYAGREDNSSEAAAGIYELWRPSGGEETGEWMIRVPGPPPHGKPSFGEAIAAVEATISSDVARHPHGLHVVHGGVVYGPEGDLLLSGNSGAGKTTLSLALATRGLRVGGDDMSMLDPVSGVCVPHPRCFHIDERSAGMLAELGLGLPADGLRDQFVTPGDLGLPSPPAARIRFVFLLEPERLAAPRIVPETQAQAASRLLLQTGRGHFRDMDGVRAMSRFVGEAQCYRLWSGALGETVREVAHIATLRKM